MSWDMYHYAPRARRHAARGLATSRRLPDFVKGHERWKDERRCQGPSARYLRRETRTSNRMCWLGHRWPLPWTQERANTTSLFFIADPDLRDRRRVYAACMADVPFYANTAHESRTEGLTRDDVMQAAQMVRCKIVMLR